MRLFKVILYSLIFSTSAFGASADYDKVANFLCSTPLNNKTFVYADDFAPGFIKAVPESYFTSIIKSLTDTTGKCASISQVLVLPSGARYNFVSSTGDYSTLDFHIDDKGMIDTFLLHGVSLPSVVIKNWADINSYSKNLHGDISVTIKSDTGRSDRRLGDALHPLGSAFKLYVLGTAIDKISNGTLKWTDTFPITKDWKSLPSGQMQDWPDGKAVTVQQYAESMIKISDNTATDHLIHILGRGDVEKQLSIMGNDFISKNEPLLMTSEMFRLKWAAPTDIINQFLNGNETVRRDLLNQKIDPTPLSQVGKNGISMENPSFITDIEWFGSTNSLCTAMSTLKNKNSPEAMSILAKSVPLLDLGASSQWEYGGFKGGSEPGVLTMTFLLKSKSQYWGCVSVAWHDTAKPLNEYVMFDFVQKVLKVAEDYF